MANATVYKFPINNSLSTINLPAGAEPLKVAMQNGSAVMWVKLDPEAPTVDRRHFEIYGTGHTIRDAEKRTYVDTFFDGPFVFHVFEVTS